MSIAAVPGPAAQAKQCVDLCAILTTKEGLVIGRTFIDNTTTLTKEGGRALYSLGEEAAPHVKSAATAARALAGGLACVAGGVLIADGVLDKDLSKTDRCIRIGSGVAVAGLAVLCSGIALSTAGICLATGFTVKALLFSFSSKAGLGQ